MTKIVRECSTGYGTRMWRRRIAASCLMVALAAACTKKSADKNAQSPSAPQPLAGETPQTGMPSGNGSNLERLFRYSLSSSAGEALFCQDFSSQTQAPLADIESLTNTMALAQAQVPAGVLNPFTPKTLGLVVQGAACKNIPNIIKTGHCAVTVAGDVSSGKLSIQTEQRLLWKDLPILAQASYIQATIDNKNSMISGKNDLFKNIQRQITQQQQFLTILQLGQQLTTGEQSKLIQQAQETLTNLQAQATQIEGEVKSIEDEIRPYQDELSKTVEKLEASRSSLRQACTPAGMGASSAEWKPN